MAAAQHTPRDNAKQYVAFISYSHKDKAWGDWLHKAIETYRIPKDLAKDEPAAAPFPKKLFPVFRDQEELPTSASLNVQIQTALEQSRYLIVICSPNAARSQWVNEEIKTFKAMGRADRILAVIVDGEPNASDKGDEAGQECFPKALRYEVDQKGHITGRRVEPLAADVRPGMNTKADALLKLVAGLLGVGYDALKRREQERRIRFLVKAGAAMLVLAAVMAGLAWKAVLSEREAVTAKNHAEEQRSVAEAERERAQQEKRQALHQLGRMEYERAKGFFAAGRVLSGLQSAARATGCADLGGQVENCPELLREDSEEFLLARGLVRAYGGYPVLWEKPNGAAKASRQEGAVVAALGSGNVLALANDTGLVRLVDTADAKTEKVLKMSGAGVRSVCLSKDAAYVAALDVRGRVNVWDVAQGGHIRLESKAGKARYVGFIPNTWSMVVQFEDKSVSVIDARTNQVTDTFAWKREVTGVAPGGQFLVSYESENGLYLFDMRARKEGRRVGLPTPGEQMGFGVVAALNPSATLAALAGEDDVVRVWDVGSGKLRWELRGHKDTLQSMAFSPDGSLLATSDDFGETFVWSMETGKLKAILEEDSEYMLQVFFNAEGSALYTVGPELVRAWDLRACLGPQELQGHSRTVKGMLFSPKQNRLLSSAADGLVRGWDVDARRQLPVLLKEPDEATDIVVDAGATRLAVSFLSGKVVVYDFATANTKAWLSPEADYVLDMTFSPDGKFLFLELSKGETLLDAVSMKPVRLAGPVDGGVFFHPDGRRMGYFNGSSFCLADLYTGVEEKQEKGTFANVHFSPDGTFFHTEKAVYDLATATMRVSMNTYGIVYSPDGRYVASWDGLYDLCTGRALFAPEYSGAYVFSPDSSQIACQYHDGATSLYDIASAKVVSRYQTSADTFGALRFNAAGSYLAVSGTGNDITVLRVATPRPAPKDFLAVSQAP